VRSELERPLRKKFSAPLLDAYTRNLQMSGRYTAIALAGFSALDGPFAEGTAVILELFALYRSDAGLPALSRAGSEIPRRDVEDAREPQAEDEARRLRLARLHLADRPFGDADRMRQRARRSSDSRGQVYERRSVGWYDVTRGTVLQSASTDRASGTMRGLRRRRRGPTPRSRPATPPAAGPPPRTGSPRRPRRSDSSWRRAR